MPSWPSSSHDARTASNRNCPSLRPRSPTAESPQTPSRSAPRMASNESAGLVRRSSPSRAVRCSQGHTGPEPNSLAAAALELGRPPNRGTVGRGRPQRRREFRAMISEVRRCMQCGCRRGRELLPNLRRRFVRTSPKRGAAGRSRTSPKRWLAARSRRHIGPRVHRPGAIIVDEQLRKTWTLEPKPRRSRET